MKRIKVSPLGMAVVAAFIAIIGLGAAHAKEPTKVQNPVPVIGETADHKYKVYDLKGDLNDLNYASSKGIIYQPDDLPKRLDWLKDEDAKSKAYRCEFICKDLQGHVVGLNPAWKKAYGIK